MGKRVSDEAIKRDRDASRERARLRRESAREQYNTYHREYKSKNSESVNERRRWNHGADIERFGNRPFIFWDGEGYSNFIGYVNGPPKLAHHYMLFGCSMHPDSPLTSHDLGTVECLEYLLSVERERSDAFHISFSFDYDVNMILRDLEWRYLRHLGAYGVVRWGPYRITYIPGKRFMVSKGSKARGEERVTATVFDLFGFFHSKYTTSLLKFGVRSKAEIATIEAGKDERPNFGWYDLPYVKSYWQDEVAAGPELGDKVRDACYDAGLVISQWHGPGALASYILRKRDVKQWHSKDVPHEVSIACRYAYAGGRFQAWRCGLYRHRIYTADINSAYIYACSLVPRLDNGRWERARPSEIDRENIQPFALYHIAFDDGPERQRDNRHRGAFGELYPLFHRDRNGHMFWPSRTEGWYWGPEAALVASDPNARFLEAWLYRDDGTRPFGWVHEEFDKRLALQHEGNPAEKSFKWALAAMYGAFAQRVGWDTKNRKPPPSHELFWAGFITAWCRAEMYKLAWHVHRLGGLISIDTDGITSTVPIREEWLERGIGEKLGQWKLEEFAGIMYWQSGFYWLLHDDGTWDGGKTRGVKRGTLDVETALKAYEAASFTMKHTKHPVIHKRGTRFIGFKEALKRKDGRIVWRTWTTMESDTKMGSGGTGRHIAIFCIKCKNPDADTMHVITHEGPRHAMSHPHFLPWLEEQDELHPDVLKAQEFKESFIVLDSDLEDAFDTSWERRYGE